VGAALQEVARLSRLVDGLLTLARAERTGASATSGPVELGEVLRERADAWQPVADEEDVALEVVGSAMARATPDRLAQVVDNLLANAVEAAPSGSTVTLSAQVGPAGPELHVADRGPGLPDDERERAFDRFWSPQAGGRRLGGSGLGLAIVRKLVEADGGSVQLRSRDGGGIDATVVLPGPPAESAD
jgi:signal transduction histidine kinase